MLTFPGRRWFAGLALLAVCDFTYVYLAGHRVDLRSLMGTVGSGIGLLGIVLAIYWLLRAERNGVPLITSPSSRRTMCTLQSFFEGYVFILLGWVALRLFNHITMMTNIPYADEMLLAWDHAFFLNWNAYFAFVAEHPALIRILDFAYISLTPTSVVGYIGLFLLGRIEAARFFVVTFTTTAIVCTVIGMFFPAVAAVGFALERPELLEQFATRPGWYSISILETLRNAETYTFDLFNLPGLTTFPSFHTAAGVVLAYSYRRSFLFVPMLCYTVVMIASTPVWGGHYLIDLFAGTAIAIAICYAFERTDRYRALFASQPAGKPHTSPMPATRDVM